MQTLRMQPTELFLLCFVLASSQTAEIRRYRECHEKRQIQARPGQRLNITGSVEPPKTCVISFEHRNGSKCCYGPRDICTIVVPGASCNYTNNYNSSSPCIAPIINLSEAHEGRYTVHEAGGKSVTSCNLVLQTSFISSTQVNGCISITVNHLVILVCIVIVLVILIVSILLSGFLGWKHITKYFLILQKLSWGGKDKVLDVTKGLVSKDNVLDVKEAGEESKCLT